MTYIAEAWEVGGSLKQVQEKLEECLDLLQKNSPHGERCHSGSSSPEVFYQKEFAQDEKKESRL